MSCVQFAQLIRRDFDFAGTYVRSVCTNVMSTCGGGFKAVIHNLFQSSGVYFILYAFTYVYIIHVCMQVCGAKYSVGSNRTQEVRSETRKSRFALQAVSSLDFIVELLFRILRTYDF